uniref:G-protein coupled receptors family 1 profile domain-containing protein n=1 Tax=Plectus sambesii TaxID=2011161 RepID=A0A914WZN6_9BILA
MNETDDSNSTIPSCIVYAQKFPDPSISIYSVVPFACVYLIIFVLGVVGNLALIHVTLQHRTLQTVQNMFILNLAASDIIVCMLSLPITPVTNIYKNWFFGTVLCRLIPWVQGISVFICTFSLAAIAIDRYVLVVRPHSRPLTRRGALIVTICLWTLSVVVTLPYAVFMDVVSYDNVCGEFCTERWPNSHSRRAYTLVVLAAQFVVPFTLMAFCYWTIFSRLRDRARSRLRKMN